jgi:ABC-type transport system involved in multi-copper enzyme maturation permease subunit
MNASAPEISSRPRVKPNQRHAFGGVWRLTFRRWLSLSHFLPMAGMLTVLAVVAVASISTGSRSDYFDWCGSFFVGVVVPILAFLSGAGAMRDDLKAGAVDYLFTRPVRRPAFIVFRYLSHLACTQLTYLFGLGVLIAVGVYRDIPNLAAGLPLLLLAQVITTAAFLALGFFCAALTARYLIIGLLYAGVIEVGIGQIPTQLSQLSVTSQVREMLGPMVGFSDGVVNAGALTTTMYVSLFSAAFVAATAVIFSMKELSGAPARD